MTRMGIRQKLAKLEDWLSAGRNHAMEPSIFGGAYGGSEPILDRFAGYWTGTQPFVEMQALYDCYWTSPILQTNIKNYIAYSVGSSYHLVSEAEEEHADIAEEALKVIRDFCQQYDLDEMNTNAARDSWLSGNWFATPLTVLPGGGIMGPQTIPMATITRIITSSDGSGVPVEYWQQNVSGGTRRIPASKMTHFARNRENGSPWGTGQGQIFKRELGTFRDTKKRLVRCPSLASIEAMVLHVTSMMFYSGLPHYLASLNNGEGRGMKPEKMKELNKQLSTLEPLTAVAINGEAKVETIGLNNRNQMGELLQWINKIFIIALHDPSFNLLSDPGFTYASAKEAVETVYPRIKAFNREFARFVEREIFKPVLETAFPNYPDIWKVARIRIQWGDVETIDLEKAQAAVAMAASQAFHGQVDVESLFRIANEAGIPIERISEEEIARRQEMAMMIGQKTKKKKEGDSEEEDESEEETDDETPESNALAHVLKAARIKQERIANEAEEQKRQTIINRIYARLEAPRAR